MSDTFASFAPGLESPYSHGVTVTPSDTQDLPAVSRALYVKGYGALTVVMAGGETVTLPGVGLGANGTIYHLRVARVRATGTDAYAAPGGVSNGGLRIVALW